MTDIVRSHGHVGYAHDSIRLLLRKRGISHFHNRGEEPDRQDHREYRTSWQYSDGLGRARLTKTEAELEPGFVASGWTICPQGEAPRTRYDSFTSSTEAFEPPPSNTPVTVSYLDVLGRPTEVYPPATVEHGITHTLTQYFPFETWVFDERDTKENTNLYPAVTKVDGQGRVREIIKHNDLDGSLNATALTWTVDYNTLGSIVGLPIQREIREDTDTITCSG